MYYELIKMYRPHIQKKKEKPVSISIEFYNQYYTKLKLKKKNKPPY